MTDSVAMSTTFAVLSDIHGNRWALEAVLRDLEARGVREVLDLGDSVWGPLDPTGTATLLMKRDVIAVRGNEDRLLTETEIDEEKLALRESVKSRLSPDQRRWLAERPATREWRDAAFLCHGTPADDTEYLLREVRGGKVRLREEEEVVARLESVSRSLVLCGHDHRAHTMTLADGRLVVDPGSVGLPAYTDDHPAPHTMAAGDPRARYALVTETDGSFTVEQIALDYDWRSAARAAFRGQRADWAEWLATGQAKLEGGTRTETDADFLHRTLREMIRIDSVLPHEGELAEYLAAELRALDVEPTLQEVAPGRPNVYAAFDGGASDRFLVFSGHSDTVAPASDWETDPFRPHERGDRLHGLGAINMKAGLACMLGAFRTLRENPDGLGRVGIAICVDQEGKSLGAEALLETEYGGCDAMLHAEHFFGDRPEDPLPNAVTGKVLYEITVHGRAAHAFRPDEGGINAIGDAARIVAALEELPRPSHPDFGRGTVCALQIRGGSEEYSMVVPETCRLLVTRLTVPPETRESATKDLAAFVDTLGLASRIEITTPAPAYDPYALDPSSPLLAPFRDAYAEIIGTPPHFAPHRGILDANVFTGRGRIPTVVFGPRGARHHRAGEYVELGTLEPVMQVYVETARRYFAR